MAAVGMVALAFSLAFFEGELLKPLQGGPWDAEFRFPSLPLRGTPQTSFNSRN